MAINKFQYMVKLREGKQLFDKDNKPFKLNGFPMKHIFDTIIHGRFKRNVNLMLEADMTEEVLKYEPTSDR